MSDKFVYTFTLFKEELKENPVPSKDQDGNEITVLKKERVQIPYTFAVRKPNKSDKTDIDLFNKVQFSKAVKSGLLPVALMQKMLEDEGGVLTKKELAERDSLIKEIIDIQTKAQVESAKDKPDEEIISELNVAASEKLNAIREINQKETNAYINTAENHAKSQTVKYMMLFLSVKKDGDNFTSFFEGKDFESKDDACAVLDESEDPVTKKALQVFLATAFAMYSNDNLKQEELDSYFKSVGLIDEP